MYIFIECVNWINENESTLIWNLGLLLYCSNLGQTFNRWPALNQYITYNSKNLLSKYDHVQCTLYQTIQGFILCTIVRKLH